jgi:hypothetical protein
VDSLIDGCIDDKIQQGRNIDRFLAIRSLSFWLAQNWSKIFWILAPVAVAAAFVLAAVVGLVDEGCGRSRSRGWQGPPTGGGYSWSRGPPRPGGGDPRPRAQRLTQPKASYPVGAENSLAFVRSFMDT